jgi:hypothetical protein
MSAKARAGLSLTATTALSPEAALDVVKQSAAKVKGGGKSLLTSGLMNLGAEVHVEEERPGRLGLSITSGKRIVELCTFSARAGADGERNKLVVGGLERYKTSQSRMFYVIPAGPKRIAGYDPYRRFLEQIAADLRAADAAINVSIAQAA